jgi:Na+-translocating ferredoxin:NAD+ oxidoreductase RnfG subunit
MSVECGVRSAEACGRRTRVRSPVGAMRCGVMALMVVAVASAPCRAQGVLTQQEALALAAPHATWQRHTAYLADEDLAAIREQSNGVEVEQRVISYYVAHQNGRATHVAYFEAHQVRTLPEVVMVVVAGNGKVDRVEILKFSEPPEYRAPAGWLAQFNGHALDDDLSLKGEIVGMTGATLTARAVTGSVRRLLAVHAHLRPLADQGSSQGEGP